MKRYLFVLLLVISLGLAAQTTYKIYDLPRTSQQKSVTERIVRTTGVVTAVMDNGYFIQDKFGDNNSNTCDAIFVSVPTTGINKGDELCVTGTLSVDGITDVSSVELLAKQQAPAATKLILPDDVSNFSLHVGEEVEFDQTLVVSNTYYWANGYITVSSHRLMGATETCDPGSSEYTAQKSANSKDKLNVYSDTESSYPFADANGSLRMGMKVDNLHGVLTAANKLTISYTPDFYGNERPTEPTDLGDYNLKVCAFNMEYYITHDFDTSGDFGPKDETYAAKQHSKLLKALLAIDADVYGLLEVQRGSEALAYMCEALNTAKGGDYFDYIDDGTSAYGSYTKVGIIYRKDKVSPKGSLRSNNNSTKYRKVIQAFTLLENNEVFNFSLNHLKAKAGASSATGDDADQGDGQGAYNATRVTEAHSVVTACETAMQTDEDILIMGDMNAYSHEDPLKVYETMGYTNVLHHFYGNANYSYSYQGEAGILDHIFANSSMGEQITGACIFHINADEHRKFEYTQATCVDDMYRCSDHDAAVVGLKLGDHSHEFDALPANTIASQPLICYEVDGNVRLYNAENRTMKIADLTGKLLYTALVTNNDCSLNASMLGVSQGFYLMQLVGKEAQPVVLKFYLH